MPPRRVLLDECVDRRLAAHITGHEVLTVPEMGWAGLKNGELLKAASESFDVFLTVDRNLAFQQNTTGLSIPIIVLCANTNRLADLVPLVSVLTAALETISPGTVATVP